MEGDARRNRGDRELARRLTRQFSRSVAKVTEDPAGDGPDPVCVVRIEDVAGKKGWWTVGGTSASSPMWAARAADAGSVVDASYVYGNSITYRDITSGNNGAPCQVGYDLVTGRGSWLG